MPKLEVVNANNVIEFNPQKANFKLKNTGGPQGPAGQDGADGFSPSATVTQEGLNAEISITDKDGTTTATVPGFGVQVVESLPATGSSNVIYLERDSNSASGNPISIADAVEAPLKGLEIQGETSQNGTPTPDAPIPVQTVTGENVVKINGKNLADIPDFSVAGSGYAIEASNGAVSVDSTTTNRAISLCSGADGGAWLPAYTSSSVIDHHITGNGGSYTISLANVAKTITGTQAFYVSVYTNKRSVANTTLTSSSNFAPSTITLDSDEHIKDIWIWVGDNTTYNASFNMQLEKGSTATAYEPYQGQSYDVSLYGGKNIFDKDSPILSHAFPTDAGNTTANNSAWTIIIPCKPNTTYTYSNANSSAMKGDSRIGFYNTLPNASGITGTGSPVAIARNSSATFTTPANTYWMSVYYCWGANDVPSIYAQMMVEKGSAASAYEAYQPLELCKIGAYQDYIYKSGDKWFKHAEIGKANLADYSYTVQSTILRGTGDIPNMKYVSANTEIGSAIAEKYIIHEGRGMSSGSLAGYMAVDVSLFAVNVGTSDTSVNPTGLLYYALATPTDTEITNEALIAQLEAILAGGTQAGANTITLTPSAGATGTLEVEYYDSYDSCLWVNNRWEKFAHLG